MTKHPIPLLLATIAIAGLTACQTTSTTEPSVSRFEKVDANKDGKLSRTETSDYLITGVFESRDANNDKKLTWAEWNVEGADVDKAKFEARDANKDGVVTFDEALAYGRKHGTFEASFREADTNKDDYLSFEEVSAYYGSKEGPPN
jgi:hypothetical protein